MSVLTNVRSFHELKIANERFSEGLRYQMSLSMSRKCGQSVTSDDRWTFMEVVSSDKDRVHPRGAS